MAFGRHLGFYQTGDSAIRSADPENPGLSKIKHGVDRMHRLNYTVTVTLKLEFTSGSLKVI